MVRRDEVYEAYWAFASERQRVFERRVAGCDPPWTQNEIIARYKFTNPFRASDRVSQYLIREVIYASGEFSPEDTILRTVLFRLFSRPATWQALERTVGPIRRDTLADPRVPEILEELQQRGPIYTAAFILCANKAFGHDRKYLNHLALVEHMMRDGLAGTVANASSLRQVYKALTAYPLIGPFMAYQLAIDINYSELTDFCENEFTVPGPGAERGIRKIFPTASRREMPVLIQCMVDDQEQACAELGLEAPRLVRRRPLHAIDCQNLFCELDKYARVAFPELRSNRSRIKATFSPSPEPIELFYPPKWGLNDALPTPTRQLQLEAA